MGGYPFRQSATASAEGKAPKGRTALPNGCSPKAPIPGALREGGSNSTWRIFCERA